MNQSNFSKRVLFLVTSVVVLIQTTQLAQSQFIPDEQLVIENVGTNGQINWTQGVLIVTGQGAFNPRFSNNPAQQKLMAQRAAQTDAYRNLAEVVNGVRINSTSYMENMVGENDTVRVQTDGFVKGAKVLKMEVSPEGFATVSLIAPLNGKGGLANFIFPDTLPRTPPPYPSLSTLVPPSPQLPMDIPPNILAFLQALEARIVAIEQFLSERFGYHKPIASNPTSSTATSTHPLPNQVFTGLVVDARGFKVKPAMSPKLLDESGQEVYGTGYVSREYAVEHGIVGYAKDLESAKQNERVADNPFVVKGVSVSGANHTDIVIRNTDAQTLLGMKENLSFLDKCRVMVVVD